MTPRRVRFHQQMQVISLNAELKTRKRDDVAAAIAERTAPNQTAGTQRGQSGRRGLLCHVNPTRNATRRLRHRAP
jgi:hypothetical protein